jgi:hypothetical protein
MYDVTIPPLARSLSALDAILAKAEAHCAARNIDPDVLLRFRLFPDMLNFTKQVQLSCDFAVRATARLSGSEIPSFPDTETTFPQLRARIAAALAYIGTYSPEQFIGAAERDITIKTRAGDLDMKGVQFHSQYALAQFYFHVATAYNILRHNGIEIGKRDFLGA